jgi:SSS family solute:Na+ symporter
VQAAVIFTGGVVIALLALDRLPSWSALTASVPEGHLHLMQPAGDPVMPWPGIFTGVLIVGIYFWCTNQFVIQRALGARSLDHGRWGAIFAGLLKLPNLFILILPGVMATALYPDLERADLVFPLLAFDLLPVGLRGLMLAALAAAILSSLEAIFNSAATLFTMDFVAEIRPRLSEGALVQIGRAATLGFMALSALWAPQIAHFPTLWQYLQSILSYVTPPVVVVFLFGIFWRRGTATAAAVTLAGGIGVGAAGWLANEIFGVFSIQYLYACGILFAADALLFVGVSLSGPAPTQKARPGFSAGRLRRRLPWFKDHRVLSVLLVVLALVIVIFWW